MTNTNVLAALTSQTGKISGGLRGQELEYGTPEATQAKTVAICDTQPVMAEGVRTLLDGSRDVRFLSSCDSLRQASDLLRANPPPDVLVLDKAFGIQAILDWLSELRLASGSNTPGRPFGIANGASIIQGSRRFRGSGR